MSSVSCGCLEVVMAAWTIKPYCYAEFLHGVGHGQAAPECGAQIVIAATEGTGPIVVVRSNLVVGKNLPFIHAYLYTSLKIENQPKLSEFDTLTMQSAPDCLMILACRISLNSKCQRRTAKRSILASTLATRYIWSGRTARASLAWFHALQTSTKAVLGAFPPTDKRGSNQILSI